MIMKYILLTFCLVLAFRGCSSSYEEESTQEPIYFNNGSNGELTIACSEIEEISLGNAEPWYCVFTSSDTSVAYVATLDNSSKYYIFGASDGTAVITATLKNDTSVKATLKVTVTQYYKMAKFTEVCWMTPDCELDNMRYVIYRVRRYRGDEQPEGGDARLTRVDAQTTDTTSADSLQALVDNFVAGNWYYLYADENGNQFGMFRDSCISKRSWLLDKNCYFNGDNEFTVNDKACVMQFRDFFTFDSMYSYFLGGRTIVDDVCEVAQNRRPMARQYQKSGEQLKPFPGYVQCGHFDEQCYTNLYKYFAANGSFPGDDSELWDYFEKHDSWFYYLESYENEYLRWLMGYPLSSEDDSYSFYLTQDQTNSSYIPTYYNFKASMFKYYLNDGFDPTASTLEFGKTEVVTYSAGKYPSARPGRSGVRRQNRELPVRNSSLKKQMAVDNTIGAAMRMALSHGK